jgi:uroporphyrinogen decarboxylase
MQKSSNKPLIEAALGRKPSRYPVWFMRQAGRYLSEYREVRSKVDFTELCQTPKLAAEVTIQPLRRFDLDAAIIFSDILIPAVGMGQVLTFDKGEGPELSNPVRSMADFKRLKRPHAERDLGYVGEAIALTKEQLKPEQTMIGFCGAPFTVATYMIEGQASKNHTEVKRLLFNDRPTFDALLNHIADVSIDYLKMQVKSGADIVMMFDTWAGNLSIPDYVDAALPATKRILAAMKDAGIPTIYYPGQCSDRMYELAGMPMDVISVDWRTRLSRAHTILKGAGLNVTLQGNIDPQQLIASEKVIRARTRAIMEEAKACGVRAHIFNVGHGLLPHTPPEALSWVISELRQG